MLSTAPFLQRIVWYNGVMGWLEHEPSYTLQAVSKVFEEAWTEAPEAVQSRLGHSELNTTNKYLHLVVEAAVQAANVLDNLLTIT